MNRVENHPILGPAGKGRKIVINVDGTMVEAYEGESIAAALIANGIYVFRKTRRFGLPRSLFCGIGQCTDCAMNVDGTPNVRTCVTPVREGMIIISGTGDSE